MNQVVICAVYGASGCGRSIMPIARASIKQGSPEGPLTIGRHSIIGMGAVVTKNIPPGVVVVGCPARAMGGRSS